MKRWLGVALVLAGVLNGCRWSVHDDGYTHIMFGTGRDQNNALHNRIVAFESQHPGVKVDLLEMPSSTDQEHNQYATYLIAEDPTIDVYAVDVVWPSEFGSAGWAEPVETRRTPQDWSGYLKGPLATCVYHGHTWAVPWYCDAGMLYYRKDILDAHHMKPPETWDEMVSECQALQNPPNLYGYVGQWNQYEGLVCNFLEFVWGNGGDILTPDGRVVVDSPNNVEALTTMHDWMARDKITSPEINVDLEDQSLSLFLAGRTIFCRSWPYAWAQCQQSASSKVKDMVDVAPMPHGPNGDHAATLGGWNLMVSKYSRHKEEAWAFVKYMTDPEAQKAVMLDCSFLPSREELYHDPDLIARMPVLPRFYKAFMGGRPRPVTPYYSSVSDILQSTVHKAIDGTMTPAAALQQAQEDIVKIPGMQPTPVADHT